MLIYGIDPGLTGALAVLFNGELLAVADMPTVQVGNGAVKRQIDAAGLAAIVRGWRSSYGFDAEHAAIEQVGARPGQGASGVFSLGHSAGVIAGVIATLGISSQLVPPATWKRAMRVGADKAEARAAASRAFPGHAGQWVRVKDHGRAEAALIARFAWQEWK